MGGMARTKTRFGKLMIGGAPRVVGVISRPETLARLGTSTERECDIVEARLDLMGADTPRWIDRKSVV